MIEYYTHVIRNIIMFMFRIKKITNMINTNKQ